MDAIDRQILESLVADARMSFSDLSARIGLSGPSTADRVRRLEERGTVAGYEARLSPQAVGAELLAFVAVSLDAPGSRDGFLDAMRAERAVLECHHLAGDDDYLLKVRCASTSALETLVSDRIKGVPGVARTRTSIALSSVFERPLRVGEE